MLGIVGEGAEGDEEEEDEDDDEGWGTYPDRSPLLKCFVKFRRFRGNEKGDAAVRGVGDGEGLEATIEDMGCVCEEKGDNAVYE